MVIRIAQSFGLFKMEDWGPMNMKPKIATRVASAMLVSAFAAGAVFAQSDMTNDMIAKLREQGFTQFQVGRTFFGRIRIDALSANAAREVVMNRHTGEVLRDVDMTSRIDEMQAEMQQQSQGQQNGAGMGNNGAGNGGMGGSGGMGG